MMSTAPRPSSVGSQSGKAPGRSLRLALAALLVALSGGPIFPQSTFTSIRAHATYADFPFPQEFEADFAIALYDSNGNGQIDTYGADPSAMFPFHMTPYSVTKGQRIGSPFVVVPGIEEATFDPGFSGDTLIYAEMVEGDWTFFMWFALDLSGSRPNTFPIDYGFGSYRGSVDPTTAAEVYHATLVQDFHTNNGTDARVGYNPGPAWWAGTPGTMSSPGHIFSASSDPSVTRWPVAWGEFIAGRLHPAIYSENLFIVVEGVVIDIPFVAEEHWDGLSLFPGAQGIARTIQALNGSNVQGLRGIVDFPNRPLVGDFNGDGKSDMALWKQGWHSTPVYFSSGNGTFGITNYGHGSYWNWINSRDNQKMLGDFDGDGKTDIALWREGWNSTPVYYSNGNGSFYKTNYDHLRGQNSINDDGSGKLVGDFNGDGRSDILVWKQGWSAVVFYLARTQRGQFDKRVDSLPSNRNWINDNSTRKFVGDFNGDGRSDVALWRDGWGSTPIYFSYGTYFTVTNYGHAAYHNWINQPDVGRLIGDFNGDGRTDIVLHKWGWDSTPVYFSNGNGTFTKTNYLTSAAEINHPLARKNVGDFNGDGRTDVLVANLNSQHVNLYLSYGNGAFARHRVNFSSWNDWINDPAAQPIVGDFDGDGRTDVAMQRVDWYSTPVYFSRSTASLVPTNYNHPGSYNWINQP